MLLYYVSWKVSRLWTHVHTHKTTMAPEKSDSFCSISQREEHKNLPFPGNDWDVHRKAQ